MEFARNSAPRAFSSPIREDASFRSVSSVSPRGRVRRNVDVIEWLEQNNSTDVPIFSSRRGRSLPPRRIFSSVRTVSSAAQ